MAIFLLLFAAFAPVALAPILKEPASTRGLLFFIIALLVFVTPTLINAAVIFRWSEQNKVSQTVAATVAALSLSFCGLLVLGVALYFLRAYIRAIDPPVGPG